MDERAERGSQTEEERQEDRAVQELIKPGEKGAYDFRVLTEVERTPRQESLTPELKQSTFSFERAKRHQLRLEDIGQTDVNDERIEQLRRNIALHHQHLEELCERYGAKLKLTGLIMLLFSAIDLALVSCHLVVLLALHIPAPLVLLWIGSSIIMGAAEVLVAIKAARLGQCVKVEDLGRFLCLVISCLCLFVCAGILFVVCLSYQQLPLPDPGMQRQLRQLVWTQTTALLGVVVKISTQLVLLCLVVTLKRAARANQLSLNPNNEPSIA